MVSSKVPVLQKEFGDNYILLGPDVWKETHANPEFNEDSSLFSVWREKAESEGIRIRIGRWNTEGNPIVILVDFTPYFTEKDRIFALLWETYKLDSLSGQWDYVEPALFGYAAGKVVESFYNFYLSAGDRIIAHFHEWMTGAGVLYLKEQVAQVGCVFTTHATVLGRSVAGNNLPLYENLSGFDGNTLAKQFGVVSKNSLEKKAALNSDAFTTVSMITAEECNHFIGKEPDVITQNGIDEGFLMEDKELEKKREAARERIVKVAEAVLSQRIADDAMFVLTSGRYEFRNKGLDLFVEALSRIHSESSANREIIAFIAVPAHHAGPRKDVQQLIKTPSFGHPVTDSYLTHNLYSGNNDPVLSALRASGLSNSPDQKIKVIFVPAYLDGRDGIVDMPYYDFLTGFDLTVFPSYYEPWGYTPMESIVFGIPTVTTSLAGFGRWAADRFPKFGEIISVIERSDSNQKEAIIELAGAIIRVMGYSEKDRETASTQAKEISEQVTWKLLIREYHKAFSIALQRVEDRYELYGDKRSEEKRTYLNGRTEKPVWKKLFVEPAIPDALKPLKEISSNLWWTWNYEAEELFSMIDEQLWEQHGNNPVSMLESLSFQQMQKLSKDKSFMKKLGGVHRKFRKYLSDKKKDQGGTIAYFSMEYGLHASIKSYSGGLGILAGDYLKEASDSNASLVAVGLLYRYGYFRQNISMHGDQIDSTVPQKFTHLPLIPVRDQHDEWVTVTLALPGRNLTAKAWKMEVGRVTLYLLDTDIEENTPEDRAVTYQLYGGDWQNRFRQEMLLGVGGIRLLEALGIQIDMYHLNEGHAAFVGLERMRGFVQREGLSFMQALEIVRASTLFTTHTPVPAGHDAFSEDILRTYIPHYAERLHLSWNEFMNLGRMRENDPGEKFSMSVLAARLSQEMNGVSRIHGEVSRKMFSEMYHGYFPGELHIGHITNGVHYYTWTARNWQRLYERTLGGDFEKDMVNPEHWKNIINAPDKMIWDERRKSKKAFIEFLRKKVDTDLRAREENPRLKIETLEAIDEKALYIGFARRFATYKRAHLLFSDIDRLRDIVSDEDRPVRFVFAGKAHPKDTPGQDLIKRIITISKTPGFIGKILFLDNYNMEVARHLISGVDVWLNTPMRPMEASGTSGQKAVLNGVLNFSVLDGWWAEGYRENAGWAIEEAKTYANQQFQDELDAESIYNMLEDEIIPTYFDHDKNGIPHKWVQFVKNNIAEIAPHYTMRRMFGDYTSKYYRTLLERISELKANNYRKAKDIAAWKRFMMDRWDDIEVVSTRIAGSAQKPLTLGDEFEAEIVLKIRDIDPENLGVELVFGQKAGGRMEDILFIRELKLVSHEAKVAVYRCSFAMNSSGIFDFAFRVFPKAAFLPHRQDFMLVKWL